MRSVSILLTFGFLFFASLSEAAKAKPASKPALVEDSSGPRFSYDLGVASGTVNSRSYTEIDVGLNYYFLPPIFSWRNALFYRIGSGGVQDYYGLDTGLRATLDFDLVAAGLTTYLGSGLRIPSRGKIAPVGEVGAVAHLAGFSLGLGLKTVFNSWVESGAENDQQLILILTGGGRF